MSPRRRRPCMDLLIGLWGGGVLLTFQLRKPVACGELGTRYPEYWPNGMNDSFVMGLPAEIELTRLRMAEREA